VEVYGSPWLEIPVAEPVAGKYSCMNPQLMSQFATSGVSTGRIVTDYLLQIRLFFLRLPMPRN